MDWLLAMGYGAIGGAVVEAVVSSDRVLAWNAARHQALARKPATPGPGLSAYVDPRSDVAAGLTRILLGAVAGLVLHSQVTGAYAAIAVGCAAPAVLRQLGSMRPGSALEPATEPATEPAIEPTIGTTAEPSPEPTPQPTPQPLVEIAPEPTTAEEHG
ncbi:hypothetical protein Caci_5117 [Catenulispora acidiphila DSM 44928]|uniref:Uncharacterized protein n=1 Tax=Catenulispora acidiphila (strain DSM 44928 / JCM 14897 / NBRC 102108 / NRRL B-24433 / ID139908) TaxID=479433 RepID=C7Q528_CATAD|nr:hypothetical protein [Catenulispora acidiphila]ACU73976.1 hypothetical protein Caci_5117 [Catenulispora acidiphila DSM 44928]